MAKYKVEYYKTERFGIGGAVYQIVWCTNDYNELIHYTFPLRCKKVAYRIHYHFGYVAEFKPTDESINETEVIDHEEILSNSNN